jgi:hypothetical protein
MKKWFTAIWDLKKINPGKIFSDIKSKNMSDINIDQLKRDIKMHFKVNPYGQAYVDALEQSYSEYGEQGVKTQLLYILANARAITSVGKELKKQWEKGII